MVKLTQMEAGFPTDKDEPADAGVSPYSMASSAANSIAFLLNNIVTKDRLEMMKNNLGTYWGAKLQLAKNLGKASTTLVPNQINEQLYGDWAKIIDALKAGVDGGVGALFSGIYESLTGTGSLVQAYNGIIEKVGIDPWITRYMNESTTPNMPNFDTAWFLHQIGIIPDQQYKILTKWNGWSDGWLDTLNKANLSPLPIESLLQLRRRGSITQADFDLWMKYYRFDGTMANKMSELTVVYPEPYRVADMYVRGLADAPSRDKAFQWYGIPVDWADKFSQSQYQIPAFSMLMELLWRGIIDETIFTSMLTKTAVHPDMKAKMLQLKDSIPPAQDIITMVVREAFEADNYIKSPDEFAKWMRTKGFNQNWSDRYWIAHFQPMAINQAYDNLRRGFWDEAKFKDLLRIADIHPRWHDDILNVAYQPPSTRELGYGYDVGNYTRDDIIKYRRWGALSLEDATKAADSLIEYRLEAERNSVRTNNMNLFVDNAINETTFRAKLTMLRTNPDAITLWIDRALTLKQLKETQTPITESKTITRTDAQWMYENGLRDKAWLTARLTNIGYTSESIQMYIDQSDKRIADKAATTTPDNTKLPSLAEIHEFYSAKLIDRVTALSRIMALKYSSSDAELIVQIWERTTATTVKELSLTQLIELYYHGSLTATDLKTRLIKYGYTTTDADSIITITDANKKADKAALRLTEHEIEQLYLYGYYDVQGLIDEFKARGYSDKDATLRTYIVTIGLEMPILKAQYRNAWINANDLALGISSMIEPFNTLGNTQDIVDNIMMTIVKNTQADRVATQKDLSKAEVLKGAKNQVITPAQASDLLVAMGYDTNEAAYLLAINNIVATGDPKGYWDMRQAIELGRKASGQTYVDVPDELIFLEADFKRAKDKIKELKGKEGQEIELSKNLGQAAVLEGQMATIKSRLKIK